MWTEAIGLLLGILVFGAVVCTVLGTLGKDRRGSDEQDC